jgi:hypothetical protein
MSNQGTIRLKVTNSAPAIQKLWNNRYRLEFFCNNNTPKEGWYYENVGAMLPEYGILQESNFGSGVSEDWEAIPGSVYPDMRLVLAEYPYNVRAGTHYVKLTYETLTASWVEEKGEDEDYQLNGLKRVSRTFVALPGTTYNKVVGDTTIDNNGTTLYLGGYKIEETDAKWSLTEIWVEAGSLSQSEDSIGSQKAITIEAIGEIPATPAGYLLANTQSSDVDGFATNRYTFLFPSVLSQTEDIVGSQKAIVIEAFGITPTTPTGYLLANKQVSDYEGVKTNRFTFLEPSILNLSQDLVGGKTTVVVEAFGKTEAQIRTEIASVTSDHLFIASDESDYDGIKTVKFKYEINAFEILDFVENNLLVIQETETSINNFTTGIIGATTKSHDGKTLYLGGETIDNNNSIKIRIRKWFEAGILSESFRTEDDGLVNYTRVWLKEVGSTPSIPDNSVIVSEEIGDYNGLRTITIQYRKLPVGGFFTYQTTIPFTIPGTVEVLETEPFPSATNVKNLVVDVVPPVPTTVFASVEVTYSTVQNVDTSNLWQPTEWAATLIEGIGNGNYGTPIYAASTYSKHIRKGTGKTLTGTRAPDYIDSETKMPPSAFLTGTRLYYRSQGSISITGPTYDPAGKSILVSISNDPVFSDKNGVQYYKKTLVTATIPPRS